MLALRIFYKPWVPPVLAFTEGSPWYSSCRVVQEISEVQQRQNLMILLMRFFDDHRVGQALLLSTNWPVVIYFTIKKQPL